MSAAIKTPEVACNASGQQITGTIRIKHGKPVVEETIEDEECPFEKNRDMRKQTLERANRMAEKVKTIAPRRSNG